MTSIAADIDHVATAPDNNPARRRGWVTVLALAAVALTVATSGFVFSEPAPVDALTIGLIVLLPAIGLIAVNPALLAFGSLWLVIGASLVLAAAFSLDIPATATHVGVTIYLYAACFVFAAFIARSPRAHAQLILNAWTFAALVACAAAVFGYFGVIPGGFELFTANERATGTFKDPNVFGPFIIAPLLYLLNVALERPVGKMLLPLAAVAFLAVGVFLSFSRGAWINLALSLAIYGYLLMATTRNARVRLKFIALLAAGGMLAAGGVLAALSSDQVSQLLSQRASLDQSYDTGSEGRFGGQEKATGIIVENPLGIGALEFAARHHPEAAHNVYLTMLLSAGWLGGGVYLVLIALTLVLGLRFALKTTGDTRTIFIAVFAVFASTAFEGAIIDSDHWRHFYMLLAIIWGLMSATTTRQAAPVAAANPERRAPRLLRSAPALSVSARRPSIVGPATGMA